MSNKVEKLFHIKSPKVNVHFTSLAQIDRVRNMMLGLPIPALLRNDKIDPPIGYKYSNKHPNVLEPIEDHFRYLLQAKLHLKQSSYKEVADWLTIKLERKITPQSLFKLMHNRCPLDEIRFPIEKRMELVSLNHAFDERKKEYTKKELLNELKET